MTNTPQSVGNTSALSADRQASPNPLMHTVAIGASAGGLEALERLFEAMPVESGMAFVVIQHLSPDFDSHMDELLARKTQIRIRAVTQSLKVEPDTIYLIPANKQMVVRQGLLHLTERKAAQSPAHPIDTFLHSLARDCGRYSVGIILSGTGSDGSSGIQAIHAAGGLVLCQDPSSAQFNGMPASAIATGVVNLQLRPEEMPLALQQYSRESLSPEALASLMIPADESPYDRLLTMLGSASGVDFSSYKRGMIERRIGRRLEMNKYSSLDEYCQFLLTAPQEIEAVYEDLLIGVTEFFRDPDAFAELERSVLAKLVAKARATGSIRVWVCGCASGEEVYSIAMLLDEHVQKLAMDVEIKIFATDPHQGSLDKAALGIYPEIAVQKLSDTRRNKYFDKRLEGYQIKPELRAQVIFAAHNVLSDAPFTSLDLVSCRNMLIYLDAAAQQRALSSFHFSLDSHGYLFLGPSETNQGKLGTEFETINSRWRVYQKRGDKRLSADFRAPFLLNPPSIVRQTQRSSRQSVTRDSPLLNVYDQLLDRHMPPSILVDEQFSVVHTFAGAKQYLVNLGGRLSTNVLDLVHEQLRVALGEALEYALEQNEAIRYTDVKWQEDEGARSVELTISPLGPLDAAGSAVLIGFVEQDTDEDDLPDELKTVEFDNSKDFRIQTLQDDLFRVRENLQATIEELESANEELQTANEEMISSNEELRSTNEEMQSVNEELYTVNVEYQNKIEELVRADDDMDNLLALTQVGVLFLDEELRIRRYTPQMKQLFNLIEQDIGRSVEMFIHQLQCTTLVEDIAEVVSSRKSLQRQVADQMGTPYLLRIAPYERREGTRGAALTLIDIKALEEAQHALQRYSHMADQAAVGQLLIDQSGHFLYANPAFQSLVGYSQDDLHRMQVEKIDKRNDAQHYTELFKRLHGERSAVFESVLAGHDGVEVPVEISTNLLVSDGTTLMFASVQDITYRIETETQLRLYLSAMNTSDSSVAIADVSKADRPLIYINQGFSRITGYSTEDALGKNCRFLQGEQTDQQAVSTLRLAVEESSATRVTLLNYKKDGTPFWNDLNISPILDSSGTVTHMVAISNDVTEQIQSSLDTAQREAQIRTLLDSTAEGIVGLDAHAHSIFVNKAARDMLKLTSPAAIADCSADELLRLSEHESEYEQDLFRTSVMLPLVDGAESVTLEPIWLSRSDDTRFIARLSAQPVLQDGQLTGVVITFSDLSERDATQKALVLALNRADTANHAKSAFLANMSHEIRTPLTAIMGMTDLIALSAEKEEQVNNTRAIKQNAMHLLDIVNDILDLSKIESGQMDVVWEEVNIPSLINDLYSMMNVRTADKGIELSVSCDGPIPEFLGTDRVRLRQILINLLGNAIKFTQDGGVSVRLYFEADVLHFAVEDTGIGIAQEHQERIFEPFKQSDADVTQRFGGTGLGLSICTRLSKILGGDITLSSEPGRGSNFTLRLPYRGEEKGSFIHSLTVKSQNAQAGLVAPLARLEGHILVAEDRPEVRSMLEQLLTQSGARVSTAYDGAMALKMALRHIDNYDLLLLDSQMPQMTGSQVVRELRQRGVTKPMVALTAQAMKGDKERLLNDGFTTFLAKPVEADVLISTLSRLLSEKRNISSEVLDVMVVEDHDSTRQVLKRLVERLGHRAQAAATGAEALKMARETSPDVYFLDMRLPDMHGTELFAQLQEMPDHANVQYVALTGDAGQTDRLKYADMGLSTILSKPVDFQTIASALEAVVAQRNQMLSP